MYPGFATVSRKEGFEAEAMVLDMVSAAEKQHGKRKVELRGNIEADRVFKRVQSVVWHCRDCGYLNEGTEAPNGARPAPIPRLISTPRQILGQQILIICMIP